MRSAFWASCVLALGCGACGRVGYDVIAISSGGGGTGGTVTVDGGTCVDAGAPCGSVRVQYHAGDQNKPTDAWIRLQLNLYNDSSADIPLVELVVRYWYTIDTVAPQVFTCDTASVGAAGCGNVTGTFASVSPPRTGADSVIEIGFLAAAGALMAGGQTQPILMRVNKTDFSAYDEPGDYSYDATSSAYVDDPRITVYRNGPLVWGVEPP
jgi:hypothetical protein